MNIGDLRFLMGDRRNKYRISDVQGRPKLDNKDGLENSSVASTAG